MRSSAACAAVVAILATACTSPSGPTPAAPSPTPTAGAPALHVSVTIDSLGSAEAVAGLSNITVDASGSTGAGLTYKTTFGDGTDATGSVVRHVYNAVGTFTVTVTVTDAAGRTDSATSSVTVASPLGWWVYRGAPHGSAVAFSVKLTDQNGSALSGVFTSLDKVPRAVTGTLSGDRTMRLTVADAGLTFEGALPGVVSPDGAVLPLVVSGGAESGDRLEFLARHGEPSGAPDAVLRMRFFSFSAPFAIQGYSPILFDGSTSRGDDIQFFVAFGDGEYGSGSAVVHPVARVGTYTARLVVVDRFGQSDSETVRFVVRSLWAAPHFTAGWETVDLSTFLGIQSQEGANLTGYIQKRSGTEDFVGTLFGQDGIRLEMTGTNTVLTGTLYLHGDPPPTCFDCFPTNEWRLQLTQSGGADDGKTLTYVWYDFY